MADRAGRGSLTGRWEPRPGACPNIRGGITIERDLPAGTELWLTGWTKTITGGEVVSVLVEIADKCREAVPDTVIASTAAYLEAEDAIGAWMNERCEQERAATERSSALFASWKDWAEKAGETAGSQKNFSQKLQDRGFKNNHDRRGSWFAGLRILAAAHDAL